MNRRNFFNKLGAAILGTAIALELPDSLVPKSLELIISNTPYYEFGWTGYDSTVIHGRILAQLYLETLNPRMQKVTYIENC